MKCVNLPASTSKFSYSRVIIVLVGILIAIGGLVYIFSPFKDLIKPKKPLQKVNVRLNWLNQAQFAGLYVAKDKNFYNDAGLNVDIKEYEEGLNQNDELVRGATDFAITTPIELLTSINSGAKIKAIAAVHQTAPSVFLSLKHKNINSPADFKGKVLGCKGGNKESRIKYSALLNQFGISDATIKDLDFSIDETEDLTTNRADVVDVYRTDQPYLFKKKGLDYTVIYPEKFGVHLYGDIFITTDAMINENPEIVRQFIQATFKGWQYALDHEEEALASVATYQNELYNDPEREKFIFEENGKLIQQTGKKFPGSMNFSTWNQTIIDMKEAKIITRDILPSTVYTTQFINSQ